MLNNATTARPKNILTKPLYYFQKIIVTLLDFFRRVSLLPPFNLIKPKSCYYDRN